MILFALLFKILFASAILNYSAECFGGRGNVGSFFFGFGFSFLPFILSTPLFILTMLVDQPFKFLFGFLILLVLGVWVVFLQITSIREVYSLSTGRAFFAYISPFLVAIFLFGVIFITSLANIIFKLSAVMKGFQI